MADIFLKDGQAFVLCSECNSENTVQRNRLPKFCSECGIRFSSANRNGKDIDEPVMKLKKPASEISNNDNPGKLSYNKPLSDDKLPDNKLLGDKPDNKPASDKPDDKPPGDKLPYDKPGDKSLNKPDDKPPGDKPDDKPRSDKSDDKPRGDKSDDKSPGDKPDDKQPGNKPDDKSLGYKPDDKPRSDKSDDKPRGDKSDKSPGDKPDDKPLGDKPDDKQPGNKPDDKSLGYKPDDKPRSGKPDDKPRSGKPDDKPLGDKLDDKPLGDKPDDKSPGYKPDDNPPGGKPDDKSPGDRLDDKSLSDKSDDKPRGDKPDDKPPGDKPDDKPCGDEPDDKSPGDKPDDKPPVGKPDDKLPGGKPDDKHPGGKPDDKTPVVKDDDKPPGVKDDDKPPSEKSSVANFNDAKGQKPLNSEADTRIGGKEYVKSDNEEILTGFKKNTKKAKEVPVAASDVSTILNFHPPELPESVSSLSVEFHVLLSKEEWFWDDSAKVYLRFGHYHLGKFLSCYGPMTVTENSDGRDIIELVHTVKIPTDACSKRFPSSYKYSVFSDAVKEIMKSPFEFISASTKDGTIINRSLILDAHYIRRDKIYKKFDGPMHPEYNHDKLKELQSKEDSQQSWWKSFTRLPGAVAKFIRNRVTSFTESDVKYLPIVKPYLEPYCQFITGENDLYLVPLEVIDEVVYIVESLIKNHFSVEGSHRMLIASDVKKEAYKWLLETIDSFGIKVKQKQDKIFCVLQSTIILLLIIRRVDSLLQQDGYNYCLKFLEEKHYKVLFQGLCMMPDWKHSTKNWTDFALIEELFSKSKVDVVHVLTNMHRKVPSFRQPLPEVLFSFPIFHFAKGTWKPFKEATELVTFNSEITGSFIYFKDATKRCFPSFTKYLDEHPHLFAVDPLLLHFLVHASPLEAYHELITKVPLFILLAALTEKIAYEAKEKELNVLELCVTEGNKLEYTRETRTHLIMAVKSALKLVKKGRQHCYGFLNVRLNRMVELFLLLRGKLPATDDQEIKLLMDNDWELYMFVKELIQAIISSKKFGAYGKCNEEIKVWSKLHKINCPECFDNEWHGSIELVIKERISEMKVEVTHLLGTIDIDDTPDFLMEIILTHITTHYETYESCNLEGSTMLQQILKSPTRYNHSIANRVLHLLSEILNRRYPKAEDITESKLLEWKMWPSFLGMIVANVGLQEHHHFIAMVALSQLDELCKKIYNKSITLGSLDIVKQKCGQLKKLCDAVNFGSKDHCMPFSQVKPQLDLCIELQIKFLNYRDHISTLLGLCGGISEGSLTRQLQKEFHADHNNVEIKNLFTVKTDSSQPVCIYYTVKDIPEELLKYLYIMGNRCRNDLFESVWNKHCKQFNNLSTFIEVLEKVCMPVLNECKIILTSLEQKTMTLENIDKYFRKFQENDLESNLFKLCQGIQQCFPETELKPAKQWLHDVVLLIQEYKKINSYMNLATIVLELKQSMNLIGDFTVIDTLAQQMKPDFKKQQLNVINAELVKAGEGLMKLSAYPERCKCLKVLSESADLIKWLKSETGSVGAVANFVEVATSTTGEGDYHLERLSLLHSVATGYSSLIFDMKPSMGFTELNTKCNNLWKTLEENPDLPQCLVQCKRDLDWYKEIKKIQGSVEVTSVNQVEDINHYGAYTICCEGKSLLQSIEGAVSLKITRIKAAKKVYSFDDLRDLESKLVLIRGKSTKGGAEIDKFLDVFHLVCRIAEALYQLQNAGHTKFITWSLTFTCTEVSVDQLTTQAAKMEEELKGLLKSISEQRLEFHALNYFTTQQLLQIRRELGNLRQDTTREVTPQLYSLLSCFSLHITSDEIKNIVESVCLILNEQEAIYEKQESRNEDYEMQLPLTTEVSIVTGPHVAIEPEHSVNDECVAEENSHNKLNFLIENLSKDEEEIFDQLHDLDYSDIVCYNAVKHVFSSNSDSKLSEAMEWCFKNSDQYENDITPSVSTDQDLNIVNDIQEPSHQIMQFEMNRTPSKEIFDIKHLVVQKLIQSNFTPELAIKGARMFNGNFEQAFEWCIKSENKNMELEQSSFASFSSVLPVPQFEIAVDAVSADWDEQWDEESVEEYMDILRTATILEQIHNGFAGLPSARIFPKILRKGEPNLLIVAPGDVLKTVLSIYMKDSNLKNSNLPLPSSAEVCICTSTTTAEEVELLWHRAMKDPDFNNIYCLVHAERLTYQVCEAAFKEYESLSQGINDYRVVVICSLADEERAHVVSKLHQYRRENAPLPHTTEIASYLKMHFVTENCDSAAMVDPEMSTVRVVASKLSGMGKSLYVDRLAQKLKNRCQIKSQHVIIPIHGPVVNADTVMESLGNHVTSQAPTAQIIHFDISSSVLSDVDTLLFSLLILKSLTDCKGQIWHCLPLQYFVIEVTYIDLELEKAHQRLLPSTMSLLKLLPTVDCQSPLEVLQQCKIQKIDKTKVSMDDGIFRSAEFQRSYQYLRRSAQFQNLASFIYRLGNVEGSISEVLRLLLEYCGVRNPSWAELNNFVKFLNIQLSDCEGSIFCNEAIVGDVLQGFKQFVVKFMIRMSRDFATPSLKTAVMQANNENVDGDQQDIIEQYKIVERKAWETSFHPYIFFNQDHVSVTFLGFKITPDGNLVDPITNTIMERQLLTKELRNGLVLQRVNFDEDYNAWDRFTMIEKLCYVMGIQYMSDPDESYVLTIDNMKKMLAIKMRFRCNIPVVIMGETGCGKTRLIRYMCDLQAFGSGYKTMLMMKVHGGITERDIKNKIEEVKKLAEKNKKAFPPVDTVLFFDEANTTEAIGLIKEIMCDRRLNGKPLPKDIKFIAACNPYRKHSKEMIQRLENAGLGFYVKSTKTVHKLGSIPLRQLVYRVLALPPSMQPLVYDFGQLTNTTEKDYTTQIVKNRIQKNDRLRPHQDAESIKTSVSNVLAACQQYMRSREDECSFVSLRDVERAMIVFEWFYEKAKIIEDELKRQEGYKPLNPVVRSLIMAVAVCYHARLQDRSDFEAFIVTRFLEPFKIHDNKQFLDEIVRCQSMFLRQMKLGPNIASNAALRENVFMMVVCIELRIPLFLVGKPGSSKSLAKSIIADSMQGRTSHSMFLKELKQVKMFSYQCSQLSTPESVLEVFGTATKFQKNKDTSRFVSVVVLDEVGLAEDSPSLPLKALHPLLEDGTSGADSQIIHREKRVAFVGISNWALDPAKMNRGVMVTRGKPDEEELILSAKGICSVEESDKYRDRLENYFKPLAASYLEICEIQQPKEFFGLRDFYSLIKMLYWMIYKTNRPLTMKQLEHAVRRNFGGLDNNEVDAVNIFKKNVHIADVPSDVEVTEAMYPDCSAMGLIKTSLATKETSWHGESRYLLFLTENYAALRILQIDILFDMKNPPFVLFGSSFPKDREYTQVCRNINQIKICMETGRKVILLNLENLYESLYDVLNQYYTLLPGKRYVDLGLQTHRIKCRVHDDFKLILIAEKDKVYEEFPTPLINRLEKHFVVTSTVLTDAQKELLKDLEAWAKEYACIGNFKVGDAFVGYQEDTPAAVVFQVTHLLKDCEDQTDEELFKLWKMKAMALSKRLLLETASPDSLVRLKGLNKHQEMNNCVKIYFEEQYHASLCDLVKAKLFDSQSPNEGFLLHITTHSHLLSVVDVKLLCRSLGWKPNQISCFLLQEFDTEMDFSYKIRPIFRRYTGEDCLLIIQCDAGHLNIDLIACARHRIIDERVSARQMNTDTDQYVPLQATHVVFIVQLPKQAGGTKFVGFQGAQWYSVHIDDLNPPKDLSFDLPNAFYHSMSEIFGIGSAIDAITESNPAAIVQFDTSRRLHNLIQKAASRLQDNEENKDRTTKRIELLIKLIPTNNTSNKGERRFHQILIEHISSVLQERDSGMLDSNDWAFVESMQSKKLRQGGTFRNCLSRKLDEVIVPIFAEILGIIDKNFNLSLIHDAPDQCSLIAKLWLGIFANKQICHFNYNDMVAKDQQQHNYRSKVPGIGTLLASPDYECKFPFSWLVKNVIDSQWDNANALAEQNEVPLNMQLNDLVAFTPLGKFIKSEEYISHPEECSSLYHLYLSDYINSVYRTVRESEFKLIYLAIDLMVKQLAPNCDLLNSLVAVHISYNTVKAHIQQFHQLVTLEPSIIEVLITTVPYPAHEMNLAYFAVQEALEVLTPNFDKWDHATVRNWIKKLHKISNSIETVLSFKTEPHSEAEGLKIANRYNWQRMCIIKMFAEHISLKFTENEIVISAKRLWMFLPKPNFQSKETLDKVKLVMDSLDSKIRKVWKINDSTYLEGDQSQLGEKHINFRILCRSFFMEVISTLCFERNMLKPPEPALVMMLMNIVFAEGNTTRILSPFNNEKIDPAPVIRSYLLQLLLEFSSSDVRALLKLYFEKSQNLADQDEELYVLCVQCFEDAIYKQSNEMVSSENQLRFALDMIVKNYEIFQGLNDVVTLEYLEAVASLRYGLSMTANFMAKCYQTNDYYESLQPVEKRILDRLFTEVERACLSGYHTQSHEFLIKIIVRRFGMQFLKLLIDQPSFAWLIPVHLQSVKQTGTTVDPFVLYGNKYKDIREAVALSLCGSDISELQAAIKQLTSHNSLVIASALYQQLTIQAKQIPDKVMTHLIPLLQNCTLLNNETLHITNLLIHNGQGYRLGKVQTDFSKFPHHLYLRDIVIHSAVVFTHKQKETFLQLFFKLLHDPATAKRCYFPTMPDDSLFHAMNVLAGNYYTCPKGHPYHIGDCGRAVVNARCPECGSTIGGADYKLATGNAQVLQRGDKTQVGHILGSSDKRSMLPEPERGLSPSGCALIRLFLHSVLVWSSSNADDNQSAELADLVHPNIPGDYLAQFFWEHLQRDMEVLSKSLNLSKDDTALIVHSVLKHISQLQQFPTCDVSLANKGSRENWEIEFYQACVHPVLKDVQKYHQDALELVTNDKSQEHDILFFTIYEKIPVHVGDIQPALWRYRARITLEHLAHALQQHTSKNLVILLKEFLRVEPVLRITQYLPEILYLQKLLFDRFHQRLDQGNALNMTIKDYLESLNNDHLKLTTRRLIQLFNKAWIVAKQHLVNYGRFNVPEEYITSMPVINERTNIAYLIPTTNGEGICSTVLLDFLVVTHNSFISFYHKHYPLAEKYTDNELMKNSIPLSQLQGCHLLNYESHIISVVLSHCHHSLEVGKGTDIQYDLQALEKKIVDRFIQGKPLIQFENAPRVVYRKDLHDVQKFMDVRQKVPQDGVTLERQKIILAELQSPQRLSEVLDVIDVVLGFLASAGAGNPAMSLGDYVKKTLKMTRRKLPKAIQECSLANTLSLWDLLSVEQAKQLTLINQEPFDKVDNVFKETLDENLLGRLNRSLKRFPLDQLLVLLHEFIITHVSHAEQGQSQWPLKDTLYEFLDRQGLPEFKELDHFPNDLLLCHITNTWREIVQHQSRIGK